MPEAAEIDTRCSLRRQEDKDESSRGGRRLRFRGVMFMITLQDSGTVHNSFVRSHGLGSPSVIAVTVGQHRLLLLHALKEATI